MQSNDKLEKEISSLYEMRLLENEALKKIMTHLKEDQKKTKLKPSSDGLLKKIRKTIRRLINA